MPREDFSELCTIVDEDGIVEAVITHKIKIDGTKMFSYSFMREFDDKGVSRRTCGISGRHAPAVLRLIPRVLEKLHEEELKQKLEIKRGVRGSD